jgi:hypothetical protein
MTPVRRRTRGRRWRRSVRWAPARTSVPRLVQSQLAAIGKLERGYQAPARVSDRPRELDPLGLELFDGGVHVVAHEVGLVMRIPVGRVNGQFGGRQGEDEPPATRVDRRESQNVANERADALGIVREDARVGADDHCCASLSL